MNFLIIFLLTPYILIRSFIHGLQGKILCKLCRAPVHLYDSIRGYCSIEHYAIAHSMDLVAQDVNQPEWAVVQSRSSKTSADISIYIDQNGSMYLEDFSEEETTLKLVGTDGYAI